MSGRQILQIETHVEDGPRVLSGGVLLVMRWTVGASLAFLLGSWLVWWTMHLQHQFAEDEIRGACQRVMPETVQRCMDTVVIQRGGARR